jgi:hypothetical protein
MKELSTIMTNVSNEKREGMEGEILRLCEAFYILN